jgi:small subunit ribosomal protein S16
MPVKIRLSRQGRKKKPIYHIVVADSRAPRDGKFIERLGVYNPSSNPATIDLNFDKALDWLQKGAQPTDTCRAILSQEGVMMKKHLLEGAKKGAFSEDEANVRFNNWFKEKAAKIQAKTDSVQNAKKEEASKRLKEETKIKEAMAEEIAKRKAAEAKAEVADTAEPEASSEEPANESTSAEKPIEE